MKKGNAAKAVSEGNEHYRRGEMAEAIRAYNQALEIDPENPVAWNNKGLILAVAGNYKEALKCHMRAIELDPKHVDAISNVGMAYTKMGDFDKALEWYEKALGIDPRHETTWNNKGNLLSKMGLYEESLACYDCALEINPNYMAAMNNKAVELIHLKRYEEALALLNEVLKARPLFAEGWYVKGKAYIGMGEFDKAIVCLERAHRLNPEFRQAASALDLLKKKLVEQPGRKASGDGKKRIVTESQQAKLEKSIQREILTPRTDAERMGDEFERPQEHLSAEEQTVLGLITDEPLTPAELKGKLGKGMAKPAIDAALADLQKKGLVVREDGDEGPTFARTHLLGSIEEEIIEGEEKESPEDMGNDLHALMSRARKLIAAERFREAADAIKKALKINPYDDEAVCMMAQVQYEMGDRDRAINTISRILARDPDNIPAWLTLAKAALKAGHTGDAAECFRKVLELQPGNPEAEAGLVECESPRE